MKTPLPILFLAVLLSCCCLPVGGFSDDGGVIVTWVSDGDTIFLNNGQSVRYIGINSPEVEHDGISGKPYGEEARAYNRQLVLNIPVHLEFDREKLDHYGRLLAYVVLADGTFVNRALLAQGLAYCLYRHPNTKYSAVFLDTQRHAMSQGLGIWSLLKHEDGIRYIGNRHSKRFHLPDCSCGRKIIKKNKVFFSGQREAFWAGFAPCKQCLEEK